MAEKSSLEFGVTLPQWLPKAGPIAWSRIARAAEAAGFDWAGKGDHIVFLDDEHGWSVDTVTYDQFIALSYVAGVTDRISVGTNICVAPYRHPVYLSKLALTLDAVSEGRFELGVGVGWYEAEFEVLDVPFGQRGSRTAEFLDLFKQVCDDPVVSFDGPHHSFEEVGFYPRPTQENGPPVLVGGDSSATFARAAEFGDGWIIPASPEEVQSGRDRLHRAWDDFDREGTPTVAAEAAMYISDENHPERALFGPIESVIDGVEKYRNSGATRVIVSVTEAETTDEFIQQLERFGDEVIPSF